MTNYISSRLPSEVWIAHGGFHEELSSNHSSAMKSFEKKTNTAYLDDRFLLILHGHFDLGGWQQPERFSD